MTFRRKKIQHGMKKAERRAFYSRTLKQGRIFSKNRYSKFAHKYIRKYITRGFNY